MRFGLTNRSTQQEIIQKSVIPIQVPSVSAQEPVITKQVAPHELSHEKFKPYRIRFPNSLNQLLG